MKDTIPQILSYMKASLTEELTIEDVAHHFGYSKFHFSREFKRHTGFSAADYLSSLKIERAKQELLRGEHSITDAGFDAGYSSIGTFSTTFTKKTGLSPRDYKQQVENLFDVTKKYERTSSDLQYSSSGVLKSSVNNCHVSIEYPKGYNPGITFVGLFVSPIPNHKPIVGTALTKDRQYHFKDIPNGSYYILACSIEKTFNPLRYFVLDDCLRGSKKEKIHFPSDSNKHFAVSLREPLPEDPPILINLPKLLADSLKLRNK